MVSMNDKESQNKISQLKEVIAKYLDENVKNPAFETIEKDFDVQDKLATFLILSQVTIDSIEKEGMIYDNDYLIQIPKQEIDKRIEILKTYIQTGNLAKESTEIMNDLSSKKYLLYYFLREIHWIIVSILCASYISAHIVIRSIFELLIGIATKKTGSMNERINSIIFLSLEEKKEVKKFWRDLCGWSHPFGKWVKEVCPVFISHRPIYHPKLCKQCLEELEKIIGLFLVIGIEKFEINTKNIISKTKKYRIDISNLPFCHNRF